MIRVCCTWSDTNNKFDALSQKVRLDVWRRVCFLSARLCRVSHNTCRWRQMMTWCVCSVNLSPHWESQTESGGTNKEFSNVSLQVLPSWLLSFLLPAALLWTPRRPLPGCFAGPAAQRPLPVRGEVRSGVHGGGGRQRPVLVVPSPPARHRRAQLLAVRRQSASVAALAPDRRARQRSRWSPPPDRPITNSLIVKL